MSHINWRHPLQILNKESLLWREFFKFIHTYARRRGYAAFSKFEVAKDVLVDALYRKRGRYARPFLHVGTLALIFGAIALGPMVFAQEETEAEAEVRGVLTTDTTGGSMYTNQAEEVKQFRGGEITSHIVQSGETLSQIAQRYGLQTETIIWENKLEENATLKPGQELRILPVDGVRHQVQRGESIYSLAKKYGLEEAQAQLIVDYPFNEFLNDETFELATGQFIMIPEGEPPRAVASNRVARTLVAVTPDAGAVTPDAGAVTATGSYMRPASGVISQGYKFYHKAIDISNRSGGPILAADSGTVSVAGWDSSGYGNRIMIDHGNGAVTLYAHLSVLQVAAGQRVNRGDVIGQMGSTGRSTGTHLHFEIRQNGVFANPAASLGL